MNSLMALIVAFCGTYDATCKVSLLKCSTQKQQAELSAYVKNNAAQQKKCLKNSPLPALGLDCGSHLMDDDNKKCRTVWAGEFCRIPPPFYYPSRESYLEGCFIDLHRKGKGEDLGEPDGPLGEAGI
jgi:hypothetical protein